MSECPYELVQTPAGTLAQVRIRVHGRLRDAALADIAQPHKPTWSSIRPET
jgi:hypothetical protein